MNKVFLLALVPIYTVALVFTGCAANPSKNDWAIKAEQMNKPIVSSGEVTPDPANQTEISEIVPSLSNTKKLLTASPKPLNLMAQKATPPSNLKTAAIATARTAMRSITAVSTPNVTPSPDEIVGDYVGKDILEVKKRLGPYGASYTTSTIPRNTILSQSIKPGSPMPRPNENSIMFDVSDGPAVKYVVDLKSLTVNGIGCGSKVSDVIRLLGNPYNIDGSTYDYRQFSLAISGDYVDGIYFDHYHPTNISVGGTNLWSVSYDTFVKTLGEPCIKNIRKTDPEACDIYFKVSEKYYIRFLQDIKYNKMVDIAIVDYVFLG